MNFDEARIQLSLFKYVIKKGHRIAVPNVSWSWLNWEADLISVTQAFFMHEYEIKISHSDFKADFQKRKHRDFGRGDLGIRNCRTPNFFWYVAPLEAVPLCAPDYAGLILAQFGGRYSTEIDFIEIKKARRLHVGKVSDKGVYKILRTLMYKYWGLAENLENNKVQKDLFN